MASNPAYPGESPAEDVARLRRLTPEELGLTGPPDFASLSDDDWSVLQFVAAGSSYILEEARGAWESAVRTLGNVPPEAPETAQVLASSALRMARTDEDPVPWLRAGLHYAPHVQNPLPWGCIAYALNSLTFGNPDLMPHAKDCSFQRAVVRLAMLGHMLWPVYRDEFGITDARGQTGENWWWLFAEDMNERWGEFQHQKLILGIPIPRASGPVMGHTVAVVATASGCVVLDPSAAAEQRMTWRQFVGTPYATAFEVFTLQPMNLAAYQPLDGSLLPGSRASAERLGDLLATF